MDQNKSPFSHYILFIFPHAVGSDFKKKKSKKGKAFCLWTRFAVCRLAAVRRQAKDPRMLYKARIPLSMRLTRTKTSLLQCASLCIERYVCGALTVSRSATPIHSSFVNAQNLCSPCAHCATGSSSSNVFYEEQRMLWEIISWNVFVNGLSWCSCCGEIPKLCFTEVLVFVNVLLLVMRTERKLEWGMQTRDRPLITPLISLPLPCSWANQSRLFSVCCPVGGVVNGRSPSVFMSSNVNCPLENDRHCKTACLPLSSVESTWFWLSHFPLQSSEDKALFVNSCPLPCAKTVLATLHTVSQGILTSWGLGPPPKPREKKLKH